jgi:hypothetical protein
MQEKVQLQVQSDSERSLTHLLSILLGGVWRERVE